MKVAIVANRFDDVHGGIEYQALQLSGALQSLGHSVEIVEPHRVGASLRQGYDWVFFEGIQRYPLLSYLVNRRRADRTRFCLAPHGSFFTRIHRRELSSFGYHSSPQDYLKGAFDRVLMGQILSSMNFIVALSYAEAVDLHTLFRVPSELMQVVPHIIPEAEPATNDESLEELTGRSPYFVTISRIDRRKNVIAAVRAASLAGARLFIVGQDGGELRTVLREISRAAPSGSRYLGILPEATKSWLLARSMALVIPSYFEGLPVVTLEARRLGTRVISTRLSYAPPMDEVYTCDPTPRGIADQMKAIERLPSHPVPAVLPSKEEVATRYAELFSNY